MKKTVYYFSHDYDPTSDPKISALLGAFGASGYGVYWRIIEMLHSDESHSLPQKEFIFLGLAKQLMLPGDQVKMIVDFLVNTAELLYVEDGLIKCHRVNRNIFQRNEKIQQRKDAGKKSAENRKNNNANSTTVERPLNDRSTDAQRNSTNTNTNTNSNSNSNSNSVYEEKKNFSDLMSFVDGVSYLKNDSQIFKTLTDKENGSYKDWKESELKNLIGLYETSATKNPNTKEGFDQHFTNWFKNDEKKYREKRDETRTHEAANRARLKRQGNI